jgi:hypothetical protein
MTVLHLPVSQCLVGFLTLHRTFIISMTLSQDTNSILPERKSCSLAMICSRSLYENLDALLCSGQHSKGTHFEN